MPRRKPTKLGRLLKAAPVPPPFNDKAHGERIQKVLADLGVASRRQCELLIEAGRVRVNNHVIPGLPAWVNLAEDRIEVDGQPVSSPAGAAKRKGRSRAAGKVYIMLYKPRHVISTVKDEQGRTTVLDLVQVEGHLPALANRLYPVGRLDSQSTGLILLTNDGELTERLTHPSHEVPKTYIVSIRGILTADDVERLKKGIHLATRVPEKGIVTRRAVMEEVKLLGVERDRQRGDRTRLSVTLQEGQNREIRRMLARLGFKVRRLHRKAIGPLTLKGLAPSQWRLLTHRELTRLYREAGIKNRPDA